MVNVSPWNDSGQSGSCYPEGDDTVVWIVTTVMSILFEVTLEIIPLFVNQLYIRSCLSSVLSSEPLNQIVTQFEVVCHLT